MGLIFRHVVVIVAVLPLAACGATSPPVGPPPPKPPGSGAPVASNIIAGVDQKIRDRGTIAFAFETQGASVAKQVDVLTPHSSGQTVWGNVQCFDDKLAAVYAMPSPAAEIVPARGGAAVWKKDLPGKNPTTAIQIGSETVVGFAQGLELNFYDNAGQVTGTVGLPDDGDGDAEVRALFRWGGKLHALLRVYDSNQKRLGVPAIVVIDPATRTIVDTIGLTREGDPMHRIGLYGDLLYLHLDGTYGPGVGGNLGPYQHDGRVIRLDLQTRASKDMAQDDPRTQDRISTFAVDGPGDAVWVAFKGGSSSYVQRFTASAKGVKLQVSASAMAAARRMKATLLWVYGTPTGSTGRNLYRIDTITGAAVQEQHPRVPPNWAIPTLVECDHR